METKGAKEISNEIREAPKNVAEKLKEERKEVKRKQKASKSGAVKSFKGLIDNLKETELISKEQEATLMSVYADVANKWMSEILG